MRAAACCAHTCPAVFQVSGHPFFSAGSSKHVKTWMAGTSPAMTRWGRAARYDRLRTLGPASGHGLVRPSSEAYAWSPSAPPTPSCPHCSGHHDGGWTDGGEHARRDRANLSRITLERVRFARKRSESLIAHGSWPSCACARLSARRPAPPRGRRIRGGPLSRLSASVQVGRALAGQDHDSKTRSAGEINTPNCTHQMTTLG